MLRFVFLSVVAVIIFTHLTMFLVLTIYLMLKIKRVILTQVPCNIWYIPFIATNIRWWWTENPWWNTWILNKRIKLTLNNETVCGRSTSYPRTNAAAKATWYMPYETSARKAAHQFSTSFLFGASMGDTRVNEEVPFVLDQVPTMEQNSEEYRAEPPKNEVNGSIRVPFMLLQMWLYNISQWYNW